MDADARLQQGDLSRCRLGGEGAACGRALKFFGRQVSAYVFKFMRNCSADQKPFHIDSLTVFDRLCQTYAIGEDVITTRYDAVNLHQGFVTAEIFLGFVAERSFFTSLLLYNF